MPLLSQFVIGIGCSIVAAGIVWMIWWLRMVFAVRQFCGEWESYKFVGRQIHRMEGNGCATIEKCLDWRRPASIFSPELLSSTASYDGSAKEGRVTLKGEILVNPFSFRRATVALYRIGDFKEYAIQEYILMKNGDIYVVPAASEGVPPDYSKHVLRRPKVC